METQEELTGRLREQYAAAFELACRADPFRLYAEMGAPISEGALSVDDLDALLASPAWKVIEALMADGMRQSMMSLLNVKSDQDASYWRGRAHALQFALLLPSVLKERWAAEQIQQNQEMNADE